MSKDLTKKSAESTLQWIANLKEETLKSLLSLWWILLALITLLGSSTLISNPVQPLYFMVSVLFIPLIFLILTLCGVPSLLGAALLKGLTPLIKHKRKNLEEEKEKKLTLTEKIGEKEKQYAERHTLKLIGFIVHTSWLVIFTTLLITLTLKFALQQYHFTLSSTLFSPESRLYPTLFGIVNALPSLLGINGVDQELIQQTLSGTLSEGGRSRWALWILMITLFYGLLPRLIMTLISGKALKESLLEGSMLKRLTRAHHKEESSVRPVVIREEVKKPLIKKVVSPKSVSKQPTPTEPLLAPPSKGVKMVALDFPEERFPYQLDITFINDRESFHQLYHILEKSRIDQLILFLDSAQTPDRGVLRRISRLLNLSKSARLYAIPSQKENDRYPLWEAQVTPLLRENETLSDHFTQDNEKENP